MTTSFEEAAELVLTAPFLWALGRRREAKGNSQPRQSNAASALLTEGRCHSPLDLSVCAANAWPSSSWRYTAGRMTWMRPSCLTVWMTFPEVKIGGGDGAAKVLIES